MNRPSMNTPSLDEQRRSNKTAVSRLNIRG